MREYKRLKDSYFTNPFRCLDNVIAYHIQYDKDDKYDYMLNIDIEGEFVSLSTSEAKSMIKRLQEFIDLEDELNKKQG